MNRRWSRLRVSTVTLLGAAGLILATPNSALASSHCNGTAFATPPPKWGPVSQTSTGVLGRPGYKQSYIWVLASPNDVPICVQAKGFDAHGHAQWYGIGCNNGAGHGVVPWGNVGASPAIRAMTGSTVGASIHWTC